MNSDSPSLPARHHRPQPALEIAALPPAAPISTAEGSQPYQQVSRPLTPAPERRLRVLMVDDSDIVRKVTGRMLEKLGCEVEYALNGCEAVDMCQRAEYDLILMDCQMPEMDGPSATRAIRAQHTGFQPRIVAFTANVLDENRRACMEAGMDDFVTKPLDMGQLAGVLASIE